MDLQRSDAAFLRRCARQAEHEHPRMTRGTIARLITLAGYGHNADWWRQHHQASHVVNQDWLKDMVRRGFARLPR